MFLEKNYQTDKCAASSFIVFLQTATSKLEVAVLHEQQEGPQRDPSSQQDERASEIRDTNLMTRLVFLVLQGVARASQPELLQSVQLT